MSCVAPGPYLFTGLAFLLLASISNPNDGPDSPSGDLAAAPIGGLFLSRIDGSLWSKVGGAGGAAPFGVWTSRS
jgi:hypothetical protein